jgi:hypothetical protein
MLQLRGIVRCAVAHELLQSSKKTMQQHTVDVADMHYIIH